MDGHNNVRLAMIRRLEIVRSMLDRGPRPAEAAAEASNGRTCSSPWTITPASALLGCSLTKANAAAPIGARSRAGRSASFDQFFANRPTAPRTRVLRGEPPCLRTGDITTTGTLLTKASVTCRP